MKQLIKFFKVDSSANRVFGLDLMRFFAITVVLIGHGNDLLPTQLAFVGRLLFIDGVTIFFVLSGYLIGTLLIKALYQQGASIRTLFDFWIRRWFRTLPAYYFVLVILCLIHGQFSKSIILPYFVFAQNLTMPLRATFFFESWSLAVEEWFYIVTPILISLFIAFLKLSVRRSVALTAGIVIVAVTAFRAYRYFVYHPANEIDWGSLFVFQVVTRLDSCAWGVLGAWIAFYLPNLWVKYKNGLLLLGCFGLIVGQLLKVFYVPTNITLFACVFWFSLTSLSALCVLPFLSEWKTSRSWLAKPIIFTSIISYSLYLINLTVAWKIATVDYVNQGKFIGTVVYRYLPYWGVTFLLATLQFVLIEQPMLKLRDALFGRAWLGFRPVRS